MLRSKLLPANFNRIPRSCKIVYLVDPHRDQFVNKGPEWEARQLQDGLLTSRSTGYPRVT